MGNSELRPHNGMSRREALRAGAVVAGSALWATPVVQVLSVSSASAQAPSGARGGRPNSGRGNGSEPTPANDVDPGKSQGRNKGGD